MSASLTPGAFPRSLFPPIVSSPPGPGLREKALVVGDLAHRAAGRIRQFNPKHWDPGTWPAKATGFGWHEAPRGSLGHWVEIEGRCIKNLPTTWNAGPRAQGREYKLPGVR
jgi:hypothetical protein